MASTPVIASWIAGNIGLLGEDYPGYFEVGDTRELARLMFRAETERQFLAGMELRCGEMSRLFHPAWEKESWLALLTALEG